jgi:hypothetical protein
VHKEIWTGKQVPHPLFPPSSNYKTHISLQKSISDHQFATHFFPETSLWFFTVKQISPSAKKFLISTHTHTKEITIDLNYESLASKKKICHRSRELCEQYLYGLLFLKLLLQ